MRFCIHQLLPSKSSIDKVIGNTTFAGNEHTKYGTKFERVARQLYKGESKNLENGKTSGKW